MSDGVFGPDDSNADGEDRRNLVYIAQFLSQIKYGVIWSLLLPYALTALSGSVIKVKMKVAHVGEHVHCTCALHALGPGSHDLRCKSAIKGLF